MYIVSNVIDTTLNTALEFDRYVSTFIDHNEGLKVEVSTNNGSTWTELAFYSQNNNEDDSTWYTESLDISSYQSSTFKLRFTGISSSNSELIYLDNISFITAATTSQIYDDFESTLSLWTLTSQDDDDWNITQQSSPILSPSGNHVVSSKNCDRECYMISNVIDTTNLPTLEFKRFISSTIDRNEGLKVYVSSNNGVNWTELAFYSQNNNEDDSTWHTETLDISSYQSSTFKLKFTGISSSRSEWIHIDDIVFPTSSTGIPTTSAVYDEQFNDLTGWTKSGTNNWSVVTSWNEDWPENAAPGDKILAGNACSTACILTSDAIDLSSHTSVTLELSRFVDRSLDNSEYLAIEVYNGRTWAELERWTDNNNQDTDIWETETYDISNYIDDNFKLRLSTQQNRSSEDTGVNYIKIIT